MVTVESQIVLTKEEHKFLAELLEEALKNTRVEEHRTRTMSYRENVVHHKELLLSILTKLGRPNE